MSFNRPQFLGPVLDSLRGQRNGLLDGREVHLFQDGAVNRYSRIRYAKEPDIAASIETFRAHFPNGVVHISQDNIGICENYRRAERYFFDERQFDVGYFLEDDLVLSPVYIEMLDRLCAWAISMPNVAYFAAYGDYYSMPEDIAARSRELMTLDHHWAFGLLRRHWRKMQALLEPFYGIVCASDYSRRDHRRIYDLYAFFEASPRASSQDAAKAFACDRLGLWRTNTTVPFAKYIGNVGQHMTPETYASIGFDRAVVSNEPVQMLRFPDETQIERYLADQRSQYSEIRKTEFTALLAGLPPREYNPLRLCDRNDVILGYRLLLTREPESEQVVGQSVGCRTVFEFVSALAASDEFQHVSETNPISWPCSRDDVTYTYRLCLHRDPENERLFEEHVGKTDAGVLTRATWRSPPRQDFWASVEVPE